MDNIISGFHKSDILGGWENMIKQGEIVTTERNCGIDLLKIFAALGVVTNHILMQGGVINAEISEGKKAIVWLIESIAYLSVDCYIIASGYVNYRDEFRDYRFHRIIDLWLQVVFWGLILNFLPMIFLKQDVSLNVLLMSLLPVTFNQYWFFSAYFALLFVMPILNVILSALGGVHQKRCISVCIIIFSVYATLASPLGDQFGLSQGFSFIWFCMLYVIGAAIKKHNLLQYENKKLITGFVTGVLITWFCVTFLGKITNRLIGKEFGESILLSYNSPTVLLAAMCLVALFSRLKLRKGQKAIQYWSKATFGVYIIHMHPWVKENLLTDRFVFICSEPIYLIPFEILGIGIAIMAICMLMDKGREYIFKILRINEIENRINTVINRWLP